jgi:hypothetical protein
VKRFILIGIVLIILIQTSIKSAIVVYYFANKEYITNVFCENKAKPQMACNGKCYLSKQIKLQEEKENKLPATILKNIKETILFCSTIHIEIPSLDFTFKSLTIPSYKLKFYLSPLASIFQPPQ